MVEKGDEDFEDIVDGVEGKQATSQSSILNVCLRERILNRWSR